MRRCADLDSDVAQFPLEGLYAPAAGVVLGAALALHEGQDVLEVIQVLVAGVEHGDVALDAFLLEADVVQAPDLLLREGGPDAEALHSADEQTVLVALLGLADGVEGDGGDLPSGPVQVVLEADGSLPV